MTKQAQASLTGNAGDRPLALVLFALAMAGVPPEPPLPGPVLVRLLVDLGLSESGGRSAILRARRGGWLTSVRTGRTAGYAPAPTVQAGHRRRQRTFSGPPPHWDGTFHALLVTVPERERAFRDELRRFALIAGYRTLRAGLLVAPNERSDELGAVLDHVPPGASVIVARLVLAPEDARRVASELWALDDLASRYLRAAAEARAKIAESRRHPPVGPDAVRTLAAATLAIYEALAYDPGLPPELLPAAWPGAILGAALGEALRTFSPAVESYVSLLRGSD